MFFDVTNKTVWLFIHPVSCELMDMHMRVPVHVCTHVRCSTGRATKNQWGRGSAPKCLSLHTRVPACEKTRAVHACAHGRACLPGRASAHICPTCVHVCAHLYMHLCVSACMCVHLWLCTFVHVCACNYACQWLCVIVCVCEWGADLEGQRRNAGSCGGGCWGAGCWGAGSFGQGVAVQGVWYRLLWCSVLGQGIKVRDVGVQGVGCSVLVAGCWGTVGCSLLLAEPRPLCPFMALPVPQHTCVHTCR